jgi:hypothetical protein
MESSLSHRPNINLVIETPTIEKESDKLIPSVKARLIEPNQSEKVITKENITAGLTFNDKDSVLDMGTNKSSEIEAPKTLERLEKIAKENNEKRKAEEAEYDDDDDYEDEEKLQIFSNTNLELDKIDVHNLNKKFKLKPDPILDDIEVLA